MLIDPDVLVEALAGVVAPVVPPGERAEDPWAVAGMVVGLIAELDDRRRDDLARSVGPARESALAADLAVFVGPLEVELICRVVDLL